MATAPEEMEDLSKVTGALLVNFGTIQSLAGMLAAGTLLVYQYLHLALCYHHNPVLLAPALSIYVILELAKRDDLWLVTVVL